MINKLYESYSLPTEFLPQYTSNGNKDMKSATELLKKFELGMTTKSFNVLLKANGYLEERTRKSSQDKPKKYNALTEKGLKYGEKLISPHNQREVQPMYYVDTFKELFKMIV